MRGEQVPLTEQSTRRLRSKGPAPGLADRAKAEIARLRRELRSGGMTLGRRKELETDLKFAERAAQLEGVDWDDFEGMRLVENWRRRYDG